MQQIILRYQVFHIYIVTQKCRHMIILQSAKLKKSRRNSLMGQERKEKSKAFLTVRTNRCKDVKEGIIMKRLKSEFDTKLTKTTIRLIQLQYYKKIFLQTNTLVQNDDDEITVYIFLLSPQKRTVHANFLFLCLEKCD